MFKELNEMIEASSNVNLKEGSTWWFDRQAQRRYIFQIQVELVFRGEEPEDALRIAEETVQSYFERHIQQSTRIGY